MADNHTPLPGLRNGPANVPLLQTGTANPTSIRPPASFSPTPEAAPVHTPSEHALQHEELPMQEAVEHEIHDAEVAQFIQSKRENIRLSPDLASHGLKAVTHTNFPAYQNVKIPISDDQVLEGIKQPISDSMRWLAEYAKFLLWQAHISIKKVRGKTIRIVQKK
ncbi:MAG: hypothetical protein N2691_04620 [Patescibacteria group bacterium]|nr:hypothetical protein [Patescibacteria group bacterium]